MLDITVESVIVHNALLAFLFLLALANFGALVYLIRRCEGRHRIHPDTHHLAPPPVKQSGHTPEPGLYFPEEDDEVTAANARAVDTRTAAVNPFKHWDIYSPEDTDG